uniref:Uncharacterized protein n=1 Tax=Rhizophora mucronata TaxID=61149 RepID=A0A2P2R529_RHIMU
MPLSGGLSLVHAESMEM